MADRAAEETRSYRHFNSLSLTFSPPTVINTRPPDHLISSAIPEERSLRGMPKSILGSETSMSDRN